MPLLLSRLGRHWDVRCGRHRGAGAGRAMHAPAAGGAAPALGAPARDTPRHAQPPAAPLPYSTSASDTSGGRMAVNTTRSTTVSGTPNLSTSKMV